MKLHYAMVLAAGVLLAASASAGAGELAVGPGKAYATIAAALSKAAAGDTIMVYPQADNKPYDKVAVTVRKQRITFKAVPARPRQRVALSGKGFDYSGSGPVPRAIFQFDPQADSCVLEGFELIDAHNDSHNGAGVRINQANNVTVRDCEIHNCDMGIMSNGDGTERSAVNQRIECCLIHSNGSLKEPGQNHNLYLGGTSVTLVACEVHSSLTGHNVKSRAHLTWVEYCYIHDSANREFDLVDAKGDTTAPDSNAVLLGNIIVKNPRSEGNRTVVHFGADGGNEHDGAVWLVHNTIVTPFISPVVDLSAAKAGAKFINNIIWDNAAGQRNQVLVSLGKADKANVSLTSNWLSPGFKLPGGAKSTDGPGAESNYIAKLGENPPFADAAKRDFHLKSPASPITGAPSITAAGLPWSKITLPARPGAGEPGDTKTPPATTQPKLPPALQEYKAPLAHQDRPGFKPDAKADLGAFGIEKR
jgi:hypothetical protein